MARRTVKKVVTGSTQYDGAGVKLVRVIGKPDVEDFDPFLMLDAFDSEDPEDYIKGFPWHPHRGIETVTYLIGGEIVHGDSLGNRGAITDGSCQWMTAGSGILHQEMPMASKHMLGAQLWVNLPAKDKMMDPEYRDIKSEMIPEIKGKGAIVRILSGIYEDTKGAVSGDYVKVLYLDVALEPGAIWELTTSDKDNLFIYIVEGGGYFEEWGEYFERRRAVLFDFGEEIYVKAGTEGMRFLLMAGEPLNEPIAWGGPIVMNTKEELSQAFKEIDEGTFIKG
ncbi:MAG: pirin family protein [Anaerovoracaceae bacterium]